MNQARTSGWASFSPSARRTSSASASVQPVIRATICSTCSWNTTTPAVSSRQNSRSGCRSEEHTSELQSRQYLVCRLLLEKKRHFVHDTHHHSSTIQQMRQHH